MWEDRGGEERRGEERRGEERRGEAPDESLFAIKDIRVSAKSGRSAEGHSIGSRTRFSEAV